MKHLFIVMLLMLGSLTIWGQSQKDSPKEIAKKEAVQMRDMYGLTDNQVMKAWDVLTVRNKVIYKKNNSQSKKNSAIKKAEGKLLQLMTDVQRKKYIARKLSMQQRKNAR